MKLWAKYWFSSQREQKILTTSLSRAHNQNSNYDSNFHFMYSGRSWSRKDFGPVLAMLFAFYWTSWNFSLKILNNLALIWLTVATHIFSSEKLFIVFLTFLSFLFFLGFFFKPLLKFFLSSQLCFNFSPRKSIVQVTPRALSQQCVNIQFKKIFFVVV